MMPKGNKIYAFKSTGKQPLQADNKTLVHPSLDIFRSRKYLLYIGTKSLP